jgi:uncharacterized protein
MGAGNSVDLVDKRVEAAMNKRQLGEEKQSTNKEGRRLTVSTKVDKRVEAAMNKRQLGEKEPQHQ